MTIRPALPTDESEISDLNTLAFESTAEAEILRQLWHDNDDIISFVKTKGPEIIGHIQFYKINLNGEAACGLGPMSVHPDYQRRGHGGTLIRAGIKHLKSKTKLPLLFVLGHPAYYPKFGFTADIAANYSAPWSGEAFMALPLTLEFPVSGILKFPKAFS